VTTVGRRSNSTSAHKTSSKHDVVISRKQADRIMGREARQLGYTSVAKAVRDAKTGKFRGKLPATKLLLLDTFVHDHKTT
jgi:hypothetical protein